YGDEQKFVVYSADNAAIEHEFVFPGAALHMHSRMQSRLEGHYWVGPILDYGDELSYQDLIAGLQHLQEIGATPEFSGKFATTRWALLPGGQSIRVKAGDDGSSVQLRHEGSGDEWTLPCIDVEIVADGTRAFCQGGSAAGTLFELQAGGASSEVWRLANMDEHSFAQFHPFNAGQWILSTADGLYVMED
ncbi:MAG: hypothetical protein Q4Q03_05525, partial [Bowdeniella nasicola]|nr:hypothetical protein [Bowdeniella nasicola]